MQRGEAGVRSEVRLWGGGLVVGGGGGGASTTSLLNGRTAFSGSRPGFMVRILYIYGQHEAETHKRMYVYS